MRTKRGTHLWDDIGWPALVGIVVATGLVGAYSVLGPLFTVGFFAAVDFSITPLTVTIAEAFDVPPWRSILRLAPLQTLALETAVGVFAAFQVWGLLPLVAVVVSAPATRRRALGRLRHAAEVRRIRREFDEIIAAQHGMMQNL